MLANPDTIPRAVHFIWIGSDIPQWAAENVRRFRELNPEFSVHVHGDEILHEGWRPGYEAIAGEHCCSRRADLLRLSALAAFGGGWYFDTDFIFFRSMAELYDEFDEFPRGMLLTRHQGKMDLIANGVIGARDDAEFFQILWRRVSQLASQPINRQWETYGPALYTSLVQQYPTLVHVANTSLFYPFPDRVTEARTEAKRIYREGYRHDLPGNPYAMHFSMMDDTTP